MIITCASESQKIFEKKVKKIMLGKTNQTSIKIEHLYGIWQFKISDLLLSYKTVY